MAFLADTVPFQGQQTNIAGALQIPSLTGLQYGAGGQINIADLVRSLSAPTYTGGTGIAFPAATTSGQIGAVLAGGGSAEAQNISQLLADLGITTGAGGINTLQQAEQIETTGTLPQGAQDIVAQNLQQRQAAIRGKYAQFGMTGSSDEANELDQAQRQSVQDEFTLSQNIGQLLGSQGLSAAQLGFGTAGAGGNLSAALAQLGFGGLATAGSQGTALSQVGLSGLGLTSTDLQNIVSDALAGFGMQEGIWSDQAKQQLSADQQVTDVLTSFFKALGGGVKPT